MNLFSRLPARKIATEQPSHQRLRGGSWQDAAGHLSAYSWLIVALGAFLIVCFWLFTQHQINYEHDKAIAQTSTETMNLAKAFEEHVRRIVTGADKDLINLKTTYERDILPRSLLSAYVDDLGNDPARSQVSISNEQGIIVASLDENALAANISDRDHFRFHRSAAAETLFIGKPVQGRLSGQAVIPLSRRVTKPDGSFGGIVYIGLKADYFLDYYKRLDLGKNQLLALNGLDGFNRVRQAGNDSVGGHDTRSGDLWKNIQAGGRYGTYTSTSYLDGISRVISYRVMPDYPLVVMVGIATETALAESEKRKKSYLLGASTASLFVLAFGALVIRRAASLRRLNIEMTRLDRLNLIGEMAASIGHEVRNPLTTVRGYLQLFGRKAAFAAYRDQLDLMIAELDRANGIISEFLSLAKNKAVVMTPTDLNQVIESIVLLLQSDALLRGSSIELELGNIPAVPADDKEIRQCILNLVRNGLDATPKGGTVTISTAADGNRVVLTVRDQGPGIPPEVSDKIGTPFFTTKENGTGLGLAVCYSIALRHRATIEIDTGPGGTAFRFIFNPRDDPRE